MMLGIEKLAFEFLTSAYSDAQSEDEQKALELIIRRAFKLKPVPVTRYEYAPCDGGE